MFKKWTTGAVTAALVGMLAMGCSDSGSDFFPPTSSVFLTDSYPGPSVQATSWVGSDFRALSHNGFSVNSATVTWSVMTGSDVGILTYRTPGANELLASYWNGTTFTPPVELIGINYDATATPTLPVVLWLNPTGTAGSRAGDAIVMFARTELDDPTTVNTSTIEAGTRIYSCYFDASVASVAQNGTVRYGFDTLGQYVDTPLFNGANRLTIATASLGFVSDSVHNSYGTGGGSWEGESGDTTSFVYAVWVAQASATTANRLYSREFTLDPTTNTTNTFSGTIGSNAGTAPTGGSVGSGWTAHNGTVFFTSPETNNTSILNYMNLNVSTNSVVVSHQEAAIAGDAADITAGLPSASNVYGADHGLATVTAIFTESGNGDNSGVVTVHEDTDLMLVVVSPTTATAVTPVEIDQFTGTRIATTVDAVPTLIGTRISKDATNIMAFFLQDAEADSGTATELNIPCAVAIQTELTSAAATTARTLANSPSNVVALSTLTTSTGGVGDAGTQRIQVGLADGTGDPACNDQSSAVVMNVLWTQVTSATSESLLTNGLKVTLDATGTAAPTAALTAQATVDTQHSSWSGFGSPVAFDRGDSAGNVAVAFQQQHSSPDSASSGTLTADDRLYFWDGSATTLIGSPAPTGTPRGSKLVSSPTAVATGVTTTSAGTGVSIFWNQDLYVTSGRDVLCNRFWNKALANQATAVALADEFLPVLGTAGSDPFFIDDSFAGSANLTTARASGGNGVEVYFEQGSHLLFNTFNGTAWTTSGGMSDPSIVDHASANDVTNVTVVDRGAQSGCTTNKVMSFFAKYDNDTNNASPGDLRLHARAR